MRDIVGLARLSGFAVVFRNRMRGRNAKRDLVIAIALTGTVIATSYLQTRDIGTKSNGDVLLESGGNLLVRWSIESTAITGALAAFLAAIFGASAMPSTSEFESVQSSLLTRLKSIDICTGRLLAGIWIPVTMILSSAVFWLSANLAAGRFGTEPMYGAVIEAHVAILVFTLFLSSVAFLFAVKRRPGRNLVSGLSAALAIGTLCVSAIWLINPIVARLNEPGKVIQTALLINPGVTTASAYQVDILREEWLYNHLLAQDYPFYYPPVWVPCTLFLAAACGMMGLSAAALKRAYR